MIINPAPPTTRSSTYICIKPLNYLGKRYEKFVVYEFSHAFWGGMAIPDIVPIEIIPYNIFEEHFKHNIICKAGEDLRSCDNCKFCKGLRLCFYDPNKIKDGFKLVKKPLRHCENWQWYAS